MQILCLANRYAIFRYFTIHVIPSNNPAYNHIFINTCLIELLNKKTLSENIQVTKTQINQLNHHMHGQAPFLTVNHTNVVKKANIWEFLILVLGIDIHRKYQFLSIVEQAQQLSKVVNIFSDFDRNPYFLFISPWKKYKRHHDIEAQKHWFRQNTQYYNQNTKDHSLNKEHFLYKLNSLGKLMQVYTKAGYTKKEFQTIYELVIYSMMKHFKRVEETLYKVAAEVKIFAQIEDKMQKNFTSIIENLEIERPAARNIVFTNINVQAVKEKIEQVQKEENKIEYDSDREKFLQKIFKPIFATTLFVLAMWAFRSNGQGDSTASQIPAE